MFFSGQKKKKSKQISQQNISFLQWKLAKRSPLYYLRWAASLAAKKKSMLQGFYIGAIGIRRDGAVVRSFNGSANHPVAQGHAETRLSHKLDVGSVVYVARYSFGTHDLALAKPCPNCQKVLLSCGVKKVYYSIQSNEYGILYL